MIKNCGICGDAPVSDESSGVDLGIGGLVDLCESCQADLDSFLGVDLSVDDTKEVSNNE